MTTGRLLIYATAIDGGGPLTILREVLRATREAGLEPVVLVNTRTRELLGDQPGVRVHAVTKGGWLWRIGWDAWRLRRWIAAHAPQTDAVLTLQNTSMNLPASITQVLYVHQPMPFDPHRFRPWRPEERRLWAYRTFYGFFITLFRRKIDHVVVQTDWMKAGVLRRLRLRPEQVTVVRPEVDLPARGSEPTATAGPATLFYPTSVQPYKQPELVVEAMAAAGLGERARYVVTLRRGDNPALDEVVDRHGLADAVDYRGPIPHDDVIAELRRCRAMVFPSLMESFGLPLIEAAGVGARVVVADAPYAHDVLADYPYAAYCRPVDVDEWAAALQRVLDQPAPDAVDWQPAGTTGWRPVLALLTRG